MLIIHVLLVHVSLYQEVKSKNKESPLYDDTEVVKLPAKRLYTRQQKKQALSLSKSGRAHQSDDDLFSDSEEAQPLLKKNCLRGEEEKVLICDAKVTIFFLKILFLVFLFTIR